MINIENSTELHRLNYYTQAKQKLTPKIKVNLSPSPDYLQNHPWNTDTLPIPNNRSKSITAKSDKSTMKIDRENGNTGYAAPTIFPKTIAIEANRWIAFNTRQSEGLLCVNQIHRRFEQIFNFAARKSFGVLLWDDHHCHNSDPLDSRHAAIAIKFTLRAYRASHKFGGVILCAKTRGKNCF